MIRIERGDDSLLMTGAVLAADGRAAIVDVNSVSRSLAGKNGRTLTVFSTVIPAQVETCRSPFPGSVFALRGQ
jgi:hypothetical protein